MPADIPQHAQRDGDVRLIYVVGNRRLYKYFVDANVIMPMLTFTGDEQGHMVGYAGYNIPAPVPVSIEILIPSADGVWHHVPGIGWTLKNNGLPIGWNWLHVAADPRDGDKWLLFGKPAAQAVGTRIVCVNSGGKLVVESTTQSPVWYTDNAGAVWSEVVITGVYVAVTNAMAFRGEFDPRATGTWGWSGVAYDFGEFGRRYLAVRGTGASGLQVAEATNPGGATDGVGGNTVMSDGTIVFNGPYGRLWTQVPDQALTHVSSTDNGSNGANSIDARLADTTTWFTHESGATSLYLTTNPKTTGAIAGAVASSARTHLSVASNGTLIVGGTPLGGGHYPQTYDPGTGQFSNAAPEAVGQVGHVRYDRQTRTAWAARILDTGYSKDCWVNDGSDTARLVGPAAAADTALYNVVEVIVRGGGVE